jgi:hypothetical protein
LTLKPVCMSTVVYLQIQNVRTECSPQIPPSRNQMEYISSLNCDSGRSRLLRSYAQQIRSAQIDRVMLGQDRCALDSDHNRQSLDAISVFCPKVHKPTIRYNIVHREPRTVVFYLIGRDVRVN